MEENALDYSKHSKPQDDMGREFLQELALSEGDKVLDMGCGTGNVTKLISEIVGAQGQVTGVDPDEARIKVAQEKFKDVQNVQFVVGNSEVGFPHHNLEYYDHHVSTHAYHWLTDVEKVAYLRTAFQCLRPDGKLAILCAENGLNDGGHFRPKDLTLEEHMEMFGSVGLFTDVRIDRRMHNVIFDSFEDFRRWFKASTYCSLEETSPEFLNDILPKYTRVETDGSFIMNQPCLVIKARK